MLFSLALLFLLTPFPSLQTPVTNEKRNAKGTGSEPKPYVLLTLSLAKPKTAATLVNVTKETPKPTLKALNPTALNQTHPAPSSPLKPPTATLVKLNKETPKPTLKALSPTIANQTHPAPSSPLKPPTATLVKLNKETPKPTVKALNPTAANQTHPAPSSPLKPPTATLVKLTKETPKPNLKALNPTAANQTHPAPSSPLKPPTATLVKLTKETPKPTPKTLSPTIANQTHPAPSRPLKPPTATLVKLTKETAKPTPKALSPTIANQIHPAPSTPLKPPTATLVKLTKETPKPTVKTLSPAAANQTHPAPSTPLKPPTATFIKLTKETPKPTVKALSPTAANQTHPAPSAPLKPPTATLVKLTKETPKLTPKTLSPAAANQTHPVPSTPLKPPTAMFIKLNKETPKPTVKALSPAVANQTHPAPSTPLKPPTAMLVKLTKETPKPTLKAISPAATNQTHPAPSTPLKPPTASGPKTTTKDKPSITLPHPIPIKVLITSDSGCISKDTQSDVSNRTKEQTQTHELKPGFPLTLTHRISLVPTSCTGGCVAEMAALKGRVGRLEKEMSLMKSKCASCSKGPCPNDCSANGKCEKGKCVCLPGFLGLDCSKCTAGADCSKKGTKDKIQITVETVALKVSPESNAITESLQGKKTKADQILFQKKTEQKKPTAAKEDVDIKRKTKGTTSVKAGLTKTQAKQGVTVTKTKTTHSNATKTGLGRPTVGQVLLKHHGGRKQESKGKTTVIKKQSKPDLKLKGTVKEESAGKANAEAGNLQDQPQANVTQSTVKMFVNKTRSGKETLEQSTLAEKNVTLTSGKKTVKKVKLVQGTMNVTKVSLAFDSTKAGTGKITLTKDIKTEADISSGTSKTTVKTGSGKGKPVPRNSQYVVNMTTVETTSEVKVFSNNTTTIQSSKNTTRKAGTGVGRGLGSVKVQNITTYGFTLTWSAPTAMFKNFTVSRREHRAEDEEEEEEEAEEGAALGEEVRVAGVINSTIEIRKQSPNGTVAFPTKAPGSSRGKAHTKRVSVVLPDSVRSVEFSNLRPQTRYSLHICGTTPGSRSKIHRVTTMTGPEPPTELVFSNVTEASLSVSWSKPKNKISGFKITYSHSVTGENGSVSVILTGETGSVSVDSLQSQVSLSKLSSGATYEVSVMSTMGKRESDPLIAIMTTVPAPPTVLQATNVTDTKAVLQWTPAMGHVDRFIISYESAKTPNVTVTVMVSGNSVEQQLRGLQRDTLYTVKALSQKDSLQSTAITTTFTTASAVKAGEVGARSAVVSWKSPSVAFSRYRVTYQTAGEEVKEVILDSTVTEYKLTGLFSMSKYTVLVQGEREGQYTSIVTTEFITGKLRFPFPTECSQELLNGALQSGEVDLYPEGKEGKAVRVYCDMETEGGGWTVFQRRMNGKTDFFRTWSDYTTGFGNLSEEFWLGNELLHNLTSMGPVSLRVDLRSGNDTAYAHYSSFTIDSVDKHYAIEVSGYTGTAGDSMRYHNGRPFSTRDKEPHPLGIHCARAYMGGWWYKNCYKTNLNGLYGTNSNNQGVVWIDWKGKDSSIPFTEMKFRPAGISITTRG
ncbi:tenascin isoform X1 [Oncorhynchus mykiss]|uniref:tenascin isoform X1 n=1 Tax=Oncorhynchus mykiss TaxID=8022 RepID=UPI00187874D5|nr:tenascin isoform X1 [Oncorhynchus mykiss]